MHITYDAEADAFYLELRAVPARNTIDIEEGVSVMVDEHGHIVSLEVLYARELLGAVVDAASVAIEQLVPPSAELEERRPTIGERVAARE